MLLNRWIDVKVVDGRERVELSATHFYGQLIN